MLLVLLAGLGSMAQAWSFRDTVSLEDMHRKLGAGRFIRLETHAYNNYVGWSGQSGDGFGDVVDADFYKIVETLCEPDSVRIPGNEIVYCFTK